MEIYLINGLELVFEEVQEKDEEEVYLTKVREFLQDDNGFEVEIHN